MDQYKKVRTGFSVNIKNEFSFKYNFNFEVFFKRTSTKAHQSRPKFVVLI